MSSSPRSRSPSPRSPRSPGYRRKYYRRSYSPYTKDRYGSKEDKLDSTTLFIGNLPYHITRNELLDLFSKCGKVNNVTIGVNKKTGQSLGYAFVEFAERKDAEDAYDKFYRYCLDGRYLRIDWDIGLEKKRQLDMFRRRRSPPRRYYSRSPPRRYSRRYSRSPSPRRYSKSPSPRRYSKSPSPRRYSKSPSPRRSYSPKRDYHYPQDQYSKHPYPPQDQYSQDRYSKGSYPSQNQYSKDSSYTQDQYSKEPYPQEYKDYSTKEMYGDMSPPRPLENNMQPPMQQPPLEQQDQHSSIPQPPMDQKK